MPDTWDPTLTVFTGIISPVAVTVCDKSPRIIGTVTNSPFLAPPPKPNIKNQAPTNKKSLHSGGDLEEAPLNYAEKVHVIPQVTVKAKKYWTSDDNIQWFDQNTGRHWATIYYNAKEELDKILDRGEPMPTVFEFLAKRNPMFNNPECIDLPQPFAIQPPRGRMTYGGRNILWLIDNGLDQYFSTANDFGHAPSSHPFSDIATFPYYLDEIKAIYIVPWSPKEEASRVRIYIYRQLKFTTESQKGLRRTHFQGYNIPETFKMEDMQVLPPLENLRRTLYWEPNVKTDENGEAKIIFYNNMSATQIQYSAEGISKDGKVIVGE